MDTTVEKRGPKPGANSNAAIFYVIYFIVFPFFFLNIFVALIVVAFQDDELLTGLDLDRNQVRVPLPRLISVYMNLFLFSNQIKIKSNKIYLRHKAEYH